MKHVAICLALIAIHFGAQAELTCIPKEYAQYKDEANTHAGRTGLAIDYCAAKRRQDLLPAGRNHDQCAAEAEKIRGALQQARDIRVLEFALSRKCEGDFPKPTASKKTR